MDTIHPTPFPGKRRPAAANPAKKDRDRAKPSTQPPPPPPAARPKRAFGIARSTNIPTEKPLAKPLPAKTSRPWKPSGNGTQKSGNDISGNGSGKTKVGTKTFQEQAKEADSDSIIDTGKSVQDGVVRTPTSSLIKTAAAAAAAGTPYQTAENCSKCRFGKLETSVYWLAQVKIAESAGRHSVSAAFFRLALECHAQSFHNLQRELKQYVARHSSISSETLWIDLRKAYGLSNDQTSIDPCDLDKLDAVLVEQEESLPNTQDEANFETLEDECFEFDFIENPMLDISDKEASQLIDANLILMNDGANTEESEEFVGVKAMPHSSKETGGLKSSEGTVSVRKSCHEKSKALSSSKSLSNTKTLRSIGSSGKIQDALNQHEPGHKFSGGKPARNTVGGKVRSINLSNQAKEEGKVDSPSLKSAS